jgi:cytosine/adenosine deaminase-related metal-dependent hydrolase
MKADLVLKGARVVDPKNNQDGILDIAVEGGKIAAVDGGLRPTNGAEVIDLSGCIVMPGVIDGHVHVTDWLGGHAGYRMMARAGTVTAVDFAGPFEDVLSSAPGMGCGLNIAGLEAVRPGINIPTNDPSRAELTDLVNSACKRGALGIKILGGHFPLTPEATARAIEVANAEGAYIAFHVGTTTLPRSDLNSLKQALELANGLRVHIPHVCTCCLGLVLGDPFSELRVMFDVLEAHPNVCTESHLSVLAYSFPQFRGSHPASESTRMFLEIAGYPAEESGVERAMLDGYAGAVTETADGSVFLTGNLGFAAWALGKALALGFQANLPVSVMASATMKNSQGEFVVDALASDGGGLPRNNLLTSGMALVRFGALSLADLATKLAVAPARMYGLANKGHLGVGADADVTVIRPETGEAVLSVAAGRIVLRDSHLAGTGVNLIVSNRATGLPSGVSAARIGPYDSR